MRARPLTLPKIIRRRSKVHGFGVFALEPITKNTRIIDYAGELVRNDASEAREERYLADGCIWVFRVNRDVEPRRRGRRQHRPLHQPLLHAELLVRDRRARRSGFARRGRSAAGEELTYDYATIGERTIPCRCRPGCPNKL